MKEELQHLLRKTEELEKRCHHLEKSLRESEDRFFKIFHGSSNIMAITTLKEGRIVDLNESSARLGGFKREELIGLSAPAMSLWADPHQRDVVIRKIKEEGKVHNMEVSFLGKTGNTTKALFSADPIVVDDEPCMLSVSVDITGREDALNDSNDYLTQIINRIGDPIFVKDSGHRFVLVNDAFCSLFGIKRDELLGTTGMPGDIAPTFWEQEKDVLNKGYERLTEDDVPDSQGTLHTFLVKKSALTDKFGNTQIIGVMRDITEYKRLEAQFLQAQKMEAIGVLAGGVAHDFNNLLNVINGYTELLLEDLSEESPMRTDLEQVRDAGKRAAILTSQLLAFGRKQVLQPEILDLNSVITNMSVMLCRLIGEDIELISRTQPDLGMVNVDPGKIQQVIMNLAVNARDAMPHGGKLIIETANVEFDDKYLRRHPLAHAGTYVMLAISDNGVGMDATIQARIFEPFFTTKEKGKGTGLGLSTVYGIVKQSGGYIWVYSEPGRGSTFKIYFPLARTEVARPAAYSKREPEFSGIETVLLVEDEEPVRILACRILRSRGYEVLEASDGLEALRIAQEYKGRIDLVLTDVIMPGISGSTLVVRLQSARPGIKALFISGYTGNAIVDHGILDANLAFLQKPFTAEGLARKVREVLSN